MERGPSTSTPNRSDNVDFLAVFAIMPAMARKYPEEMIARNLRDHLARALGKLVELALEGAGVHWNVSARAGVRRCRIDCFNYEVGSAALLLGIQGNAHLSKLHSGAAPRARSGAEYAISFL